MPGRLRTFRDTEERGQHPQAFWIRRNIEFSIRADQRYGRTIPGRDNESFEPTVIGCWTSSRIPREFYSPHPTLARPRIRSLMARASSDGPAMLAPLFGLYRISIIQASVSGNSISAVDAPPPLLKCRQQRLHTQRHRERVSAHLATGLPRRKGPFRCSRQEMQLHRSS